MTTDDLCLQCGHDGYDLHDMRSVPPACTVAGCGCCGTDDADECAMVRERSVAGTDEPIPSCPFHPDPHALTCPFRSREYDVLALPA